MADAAAPALTVPARVVQALLAGEQIADLRRQPADGGPPDGAPRFWLRPDPTADPELKPAYQRARELSVPDADGGPVAGDAGPDAGAFPEQVRIDGWAELAGAATTVVDDQVQENLNGKTILALEPFVGQEVLVLALRVHRLVEPLTVPLDLTGLAADPAETGLPTEPALSEMAFRARYSGLVDALSGALKPLG